MSESSSTPKCTLHRCAAKVADSNTVRSMFGASGKNLPFWVCVTAGLSAVGIITYFLSRYSSDDDCFDPDIAARMNKAAAVAGADDGDDGMGFDAGVEALDPFAVASNKVSQLIKDCDSLVGLMVANSSVEAASPTVKQDAPTPLLMQQSAVVQNNALVLDERLTKLMIELDGIVVEGDFKATRKQLIKELGQVERRLSDIGIDALKKAKE